MAPEVHNYSRLDVWYPALGRRKLGINDGAFVPAGGTAGQVLTKLSNADFDTGWAAGASDGGGLTNLDGGHAGTVYGGTTGVNGGNA